MSCYNNLKFENTSFNNLQHLYKTNNNIYNILLSFSLNYLKLRFSENSKGFIFYKDVINFFLKFVCF